MFQDRLHVLICVSSLHLVLHLLLEFHPSISSYFLHVDFGILNQICGLTADFFIDTKLAEISGAGNAGLFAYHLSWHPWSSSLPRFTRWPL